MSSALVSTGSRLVFLGAGRCEQHAPLGIERGIGHVDFQEEAVELGFGQRIGAFLLDRVLRREDMERPRQVVAHAGDRHMVLLHRLQIAPTGCAGWRG